MTIRRGMRVAAVVAACALVPALAGCWGSAPKSSGTGTTGGAAATTSTSPAGTQGGAASAPAPAASLVVNVGMAGGTVVGVVTDEAKGVPGGAPGREQIQVMFTAMSGGAPVRAFMTLFLDGATSRGAGTGMGKSVRVEFKTDGAAHVATAVTAYEQAAQAPAAQLDIAGTPQSAGTFAGSLQGEDSSANGDTVTVLGSVQYQGNEVQVRQPFLVTSATTFQGPDGKTGPAKAQLGTGALEGRVTVTYTKGAAGFTATKIVKK